MENETTNMVDGTSALKEEPKVPAEIIDFPDEDIDLPKLNKKVPAGKEIDESGKVKDTATKKAVKAVGRGTAAYFTKGKSLQYDQKITNNRFGDKAIGVVSDTLEKVPGVEAVAEGLDELNVTDTANAALDTVGNALNGKVVGTIKSGAKTVGEAGKTVLAVVKKVLLLFAPLLLGIVLFVVILAPTLGGFMDATNEGVTNTDSSSSSTVKPGPSDNGVYVDPSAVDNMDISITQAQIEYLNNTIPNWSGLNNFQRNAIMAAYSAIGKISYDWGGKPTAAGNSGIGSGLDCSGFVSWVIWTASGKPFNQSTDALSSNIGSNGLVSISSSDVQPGDIVVLRRPNNTGHALIYAGNGQYIHLAGKGQKAKMSTYTFQSDYAVYYARYQG